MGDSQWKTAGNTPKTGQNAWSKVRAVIEKSQDLSRRQVNAFLAANFEGEINGNIIIAVETERERYLLEKALADNLNDEIAHELGDAYKVHVNALYPDSEGAEAKNGVQTKTAPRSGRRTSSRAANSRQTSEQAPPGAENASEQTELDEQTDAVSESLTNLMPIFTFDNFVVGESNKLAHAVSVKVSESPGGSGHNPLYIYGDSGLGKTHLLHAIGNNALAINKNLKVLYCDSEMFVNEYIAAILKKGDHIEKFNQKYRTVDILLLDDIQFFAEKEGSAQSFFHIFNTLVNNNKQVVVASDVPPNMLKGFHQRMVSRFEGSVYWGIIAPDNNLRVAYIKKYLYNAIGDFENYGYNSTIIFKIASLLKTSIREIEGALARIISYCSVNGVQASEKVIDVVLHDQILERCAVISLEDILRASASFYGLSPEDVQGKKRTPGLVSARHMAMYLSRKLTDLTLVEIGRFFEKDHSSIINAEKKIMAQIKIKPEIYEQVNEIVDRIKNIVDKPKRGQNR
jgi:chromosomal replication initiator protein